MRVRELGIVLVVLAVLAGAACQQAGGLSEQDKAAIVKLDDDAQKMAVASNADWDAYVKMYYAEDARVLMPGAPVIEGREAIKTAFASMGPIQNEKWNRSVIEGRGGLAYESGTFSMLSLPPGAVAPVADKGKFLTIWKKQADGTWKAVYDAWNSDLPPGGLVIPTAAMKPDAGPEIQRLGWLVGKWRLEGEVKENPFVSAGKMEASLDCQWFSGGTGLLCVYDLAFSDARMQEVSFYGYDPEAKSYWCYDTDSTGMSSLGTVAIDGKSWTHVFGYKMNGKPVKMRLVLFDLTPTSCSWKNEFSLAGGPWTLFQEGKASKVA